MGTESGSCLGALPNSLGPISQPGRGHGACPCLSTRSRYRETTLLRACIGVLYNNCVDIG